MSEDGIKYLAGNILRGLLIVIGEKITPDTHPALHGAVLELCGKAKVAMPANIYVMKEPYGMPNAAMAAGGNMLLGEEMLKLFGYSKAQPVVSDELRSIIAHELGHSSRLSKDLARIQLPQLVMPFLAVAGYALYRHASHVQQTRGVTLEQAVDDVHAQVSREVKDGIDQAEVPEAMRAGGACQ